MLRRVGIFLLLALLAAQAPAQPAEPPPPAPGSVISGFGAQPLYAEPDERSAVLTYLIDGAPVLIDGRTADLRWLRVLAPASERQPEAYGWMQLVMITTAADLYALPVIAPSPQAVLEHLRLWNLTPYMVEVYRAGQASGRRANFFAKVGDSITVNSNFLTPFGYPGAYDLGAFGSLQPVIEHFSSGTDNPFTAVSSAARTGWTTRDLLRQFDYASGSCNRGETPLDCEYRVFQPAFALILIGTNDTGIVPLDEYRANLARVVEITLERQVIPVLNTIPTLRRDPSLSWLYNLAIVETAAAYQIPLVNTWLALQSLPNQGLAFDGVHPSIPPSENGAGSFTPENLQYGHTARNLLTLQALEWLLAGVQMAE